MKDIKHNQADDYQEKGSSRKNASGLSIVPEFQPGTNARPAGAQASPAGASKACTPVAQFVLPIVPTLRKVSRSVTAVKLSIVGAGHYHLNVMAVWRSEGTANIRNCALLAISLAALSGCSAWSSNPARTQADYGTSVRNMVSSQIYNADKAQNPDALLPDGIEGNKIDAVLNKTYRGLVFTPKEDLRHTTTYGQPSISIIGGSGGGAR